MLLVKGRVKHSKVDELLSMFMRLLIEGFELRLVILVLILFVTRH